MARKPVEFGSIEKNFSTWGTGGINIDDCKIEKQEGDRTEYGRDVPLEYPKESVAHGKYNENSAYIPDPAGRFPSNVIFDEFTGEILDFQSGYTNTKRNEKPSEAINGNTWGGTIQTNRGPRGHTDAGGASRFFYCAKADGSERNKGVDPIRFRKLAEHHMGDTCGICGGRIFQSDRPSACKCDVPDRQSKVFEGNHHPTVKPIDLMRYLVKLITPKKGIVLDPFCGSGTTLIGAKLELIDYVGIDMDPEYCAISEARVAAWNPERYLPQELF